MTTRSAFVASAVLAVAMTTVSAQDQASRTAAATMQRKLLSIVETGERPASPRRPVSPQRTSFTDQEVNAFFKVHGPTFMPEGVTDPQVAIDSGGRVRARAIVDLDQALKPKDRGWLDPLAYVGGKVEVTATGTLRATAGKGVFTLERTTLGGVTVPNSVIQELVTYYSRSPEQPSGIHLDQPFELPNKIQSVETARGLATVVQ